MATEDVGDVDATYGLELSPYLVLISSTAFSRPVRNVDDLCRLSAVISDKSSRRGASEMDRDNGA